MLRQMENVQGCASFAPSDLSRQSAFSRSLRWVEAVKVLFHARSIGLRPSMRFFMSAPLERGRQTGKMLRIQGIFTWKSEKMG